MPETAAPVEAKVKATTTVAGVLAVIVAALNMAAESPLLGSAPGWLQAFVLLVGPPLATFLAGWKARHTPRPEDPPESLPPGGSTVITP